MIRWPSEARFSGPPFAHLVIDGALAPEHHALIAQAFPYEPQVQVEHEIYLHLRSGEPPLLPPLGGFVLALYQACAEVSRITGVKLSRADGSAYTYREGHYLLPHSDAREGRAIAYAYYVGAPVRGGELDFFEGNRVAKSIEPLPNRLVLFEVHDRALHQVREVLEGTRTSIAGWFYP